MQNVNTEHLRRVSDLAQWWTRSRLSGYSSSVVFHHVSPFQFYGHRATRLLGYIQLNSFCVLHARPHSFYPKVYINVNNRQ